MNNVFVSLFLFVALIVCGRCTQRSLRSWMNPDCGVRCQEKNITTVYLRADGPNDTLHYLWDFDGNPSVLLALTSTSAYLNISWDDYLAKKRNSVTFTEEPAYTFGVVLNKIIEFNDVNDTGLININNIVNTNTLYPMFFQWDRKNLVQNNDFVSLNMEGSHYNDTAMDITRNGSVKLTVNVNYIINSYSFSFQIIEVRTPPSKSMDNYLSEGAYLQWKPVSYTTVARDTTSSTETIQYPPIKVSNHSSAIANTMLYRYYGDNVEKLLTQRIIVSLGMQGDGFYKRTYYSTWTFLIGYGTPPNEQFSFLVIMILSIGLGLPLIIFFATGIYLCVRKMSRRSSQYISQ
ncbi:glycosylated lysosomal membrane protein A-like [Ceratina calcarata]|uniref:Glycosylated lysosomal membrane protein A-like n=1 Tax=Ceratina calcarata TaxID=156304 RepID=A0AAJ7S204_9HYME|nr:glycosylated lysosomal membrane protein A-like [Ceratina calcarata]